MADKGLALIVMALLLPFMSRAAGLTPREAEQDSLDTLYPDFVPSRADSMIVPITARPLIFRTFHDCPPDRWKEGIKPLWSLQPPLYDWRGSLTPPVAELPGEGLERIIEQTQREYMLAHPRKTQYLAWTLPDPPSLKIDRETPPSVFLIADTPSTIADTPAPLPFDDVKRTNWLHTFDAGLQFSQAYLSPNWYQGGTNNLTLLVNFLWNVKLNEVYHPNLLLESNLSYKLGLYSTPQDSYHKYSISEDLFQYNFKFGVKALKKWFYSFTLQYKTQFLNNYAENSLTRSASFMSPGEFNVGLGMTYAASLRKGALKFNVSIAPVSYNLKTCIDDQVDPTQFSIPLGSHSVSQVGSNAEVTLTWNMASNISWKSRLFMFTDYGDFQSDWENTLNFSINRFLSTQIYLHLRYDTDADAHRQHWRHWMLKEILSFGFRYAFSTK